MSILQNKIDFILTIDVDNANPNGDPLSGNMPRTDANGYGLISDVAIKRKLRNRLQDLNQAIFVQANHRIDDEFRSLQKRFESYFDKKDTDQEVAEKSCQYWMDVRSFGQVITYQNRSIGLRGPVSITMAKSVEPIVVSSMQITRSTNGMEAKKEGGRSSDTMGMKHYVEHATYVIKGSISPNLAEVTGFTEEDAEYIKQALLSLFENDQSSARPDGSMTVRNLYWFTHSTKLGNASSARVYDLVHFDEATDEFIVNENKLSTYVQKGLKLDLIEGF